MADFPKFEDWTPPWGTDDEKFDAEKAKKRVYDLSKDKHSQAERIKALDTEKTELADKVKVFEEKDMTALEKANAEIERLKNEKASPTKKTAVSDDDFDIEKARLEIALDKGLTKAQVKRLVGSNLDELTADAEAYIEEHGLGEAGNGSSQANGGTEGQAPPSQRAQVRTGTRQGTREADPYEGKTGDELYDMAFGTG